MGRREQLKKMFNRLGLRPDNQVLDKCVEVCERQNLANKTFIDAWVAFSKSVLNASALPTEKNLIIFEKQKFGGPVFSTPKRAANKITKKKNNYGSPIPASSSKMQINEIIDSPNQSAISAIAQMFLMNNNNDMCSPWAAPMRSTSISPPSNDIAGSSSMDLSPLKAYGYFSKHMPCKCEPTINLFGRETMKHWTNMIDICNDSWNRIQDFTEEIASIILKRNNLADPNPFNDLSNENKLYVGRVLKIDDTTTTDLFIQGLGMNAQASMTLDISYLEKYAVFPGQTIAFRGASREANKLIATKLYTSARGPTPKPPVIKEPFSFMVAAGPFGSAGNFDLTIIEKLINYAKFINPAFLIIAGPCLDQETLLDEHMMMLNKCSQAFAGLKTKVYYITSSADKTDFPKFPIPININDDGDYSHYLLPDPTLLDINGLICGVTSTDIISYLHAVEKDEGESGYRLDRLIQHLLDQQSFYPIVTGLDEKYTSVYAQARLPVVPHILILPSENQYYIKEIDGCVIINPQKCTKIGKNFALVEVRDPKSLHWSPKMSISAKIIRI